MSYRLVVVFVFLSIARCFAQSGPEIATNGQFNGRFWNSLADMGGSLSRTAFVIGAETMLMGPQDKEKYDAYFPRNLHADKIAEAVDKFYSQPENLPIPIVGAFLVVSLRAGGTSDKFVDEIISDMRETAAKSAK